MQDRVHTGTALHIASTQCSAVTPAVLHCCVLGCVLCSVVRIRSTSLEQQAFESLLLELDANLLLHLALGHRWAQATHNTNSTTVLTVNQGCILLDTVRFSTNLH